MNTMKTNRFSRLLKMGQGIAKATTEFAKESAKELIAQKKEEAMIQAKKIKAAKELVTSLGELKGGLMKLGQMLSITEDMVLPKEISDLFKSLQKSAPAMDEKLLDQVFLQDFKKTPEELFAYFERKPMAAASIGQVHRGILKTGEKVAIKVQYPKIVQAIKADMKNLNQLDNFFSLLFPNRPNIESTLEELKTSLIAECDYIRELNELAHFKKLYELEFPDIIVPRGFAELSSAQVLTMEYLEGDSFEESLNYDQNSRDHLGELLYNSFMYSFFQKHTLHTDPQNGNYLFTSQKMMILDFGSTRHFPQEFVQKYALMVYAVEQDNHQLFKNVALDLELLKVTDPEEQFRKLFDFVFHVYSPYLKQGRYAVVDLNPFNHFKDFIAGLDLKTKNAPRREFFLLDRANLGIFTKLKAWKAQVDWEEGRKRYRYPVSDNALKSYSSM